MEQTKQTIADKLERLAELVALKKEINLKILGCYAVNISAQSIPATRRHGTPRAINIVETKTVVDQKGLENYQEELSTCETELVDLKASINEFFTK